MADIQLIQRKNQQKTSSYRRNSCVFFNTGPYTVFSDNSILITANMRSETGFSSSHQLKSYVASMSRLKLAARAVLSADAGLLDYYPTGTPYPGSEYLICRIYLIGFCELLQ